ncbi:MAG: SDR family NAD(P)-dependent oxidoreductase [Rhodothermales bacterium]|nr:SDR family NAD(P)-dependent oxidoreductase [Rhodothermales bacterium]
MEGKTIVVTGAAGRLGRHVVDLARKRGVTVAAVVLNEQEARQIPEGVATFEMNVTHESDVVSGFAGIQDYLGDLDGVIHTVGAWGMTPLLSTDLANWQKLMTLNLTSAFLVFREAARHTRRGGALVAIAAGQGVDRGAPGQAAYSAAKAGVMRLVEAAGAELAEKQIRTLAVAPSTILFDPASTDPGVHVAEVARACLAPFSNTPPASGTTFRVYGSAT